jgi:hypothetical protein
MRNKILVLFVFMLMFSVLPLSFVKASGGEISFLKEHTSNVLHYRVEQMQLALSEFIFGDTEYIFTKTNVNDVCEVANFSYEDPGDPEHNVIQGANQVCTSYSSNSATGQCGYMIIYDDNSRDYLYGELDGDNCVLSGFIMTPGW